MRTKPAKSTHPERIEVQIPAELGVQLREYANRKGRSLSDVVAHAVKNFLKVADPKRTARAGELFERDFGERREG